MGYTIDLTGRTALVTGASSGLGLHFAATLAAAGADVVLAARRMDRLEATAETLRRDGTRAHAVEMDVADPESVAAGIDAAVDAFGAMDICVNNAGIADDRWFAKMSDKDWRRTMDVNLDGVFRVGRAAAVAMRNHGNGGSIINVASVLGMAVRPAVSAYCVSKAAVIQLTKAMALELARDNIRVNALAPGYFETDLNRGFLQSELGAELISRIPMRRTGHYEDLSGPLLLLASDAGRYMTGSVLTADGGVLLATG
ncbi:MAG: SDR family NAD(P)-dependent oxidoreductase [Pseudomonadota bacterium]